jgi:hypothetical protein
LPLPTLFVLAFATGMAAAIAGRSELRVSPRPALLTRSFAAYLVFVALVMIPVSVYFYVFHGDWFLLYLIDVRLVPSAAALVGFVCEALIGAAGFATASALVRSQREVLAGVILGATVVAGAVILVLALDRLSVVGSYAQYRGGFGLTPYVSGPVLQGTIAMSLLVAIGLAFLLVRLVYGGRGRS